MIEVEGLKMSYSLEHGEVEAVRDVSFSIEQGELFTLLGPSGSGKSSILRCIAGLEKPSAGTISINGQLVFSSKKGISIPPEERGVGMVFQSYAIWPHMDVFSNVAFPLLHGIRKLKASSKADVRRAVHEALRLVKLEDLADRPVTQLSGGQQQRVGLARALVDKPVVVLLDEPLSNLDAKLREEMRHEIREALGAVGSTAVYVTHDQVEAMAISDRIGVLSAGKLLQVGNPIDVYRAPVSRFLASFLGAVNVLAVSDVSANGGNSFVVKTPIGILHVAALANGTSEDPMVVAVRPEVISCLMEQPAFDENVFQGVVEHATFLGNFVDTRVHVNGVKIQAALKAHEAVGVGSLVYVVLPKDGCLVLR
jgi:iron(III) transport system ATP-binding protein